MSVRRFGGPESRRCQNQINQFLNRYRMQLAAELAVGGGALATGLSERSLVRVVGSLLPCSRALVEGRLTPIPDDLPTTFQAVVGCAASEPRDLSGIPGDRLILDDVPGGLGPENWCSQCQVCACTMGNDWCETNEYLRGGELRSFCVGR